MTQLATIDQMRDIYAEARTIAVVGASPNPTKPANAVPVYLGEQGYEIIPVNPTHDTVFGVRSYPTLLDVDRPVDVVDVFRPSPEAPAIARNAVDIGAKVLWLQLGVVSDEAAEVAWEAGLLVVMDRCMGFMHGKLGLGPGPPHVG